MVKTSMYTEFGGKNMWKVATLIIVYTHDIMEQIVRMRRRIWIVAREELRY